MMVYSKAFLRATPIIALFNSGMLFSDSRSDLIEFLKVPRRIGSFEVNKAKLRKDDPFWHDDRTDFSNHRLGIEIFSISYVEGEGFKVSALGKTLRDDVLIAKIEENIKNTKIKIEKQKAENIKAKKRYKEEKKALELYMLEL